jgi:hypothetical protein
MGRVRMEEGWRGQGGARSVNKERGGGQGWPERSWTYKLGRQPRMRSGCCRGVLPSDRLPWPRRERRVCRVVGVDGGGRGVFARGAGGLAQSARRVSKRARARPHGKASQRHACVSRSGRTYALAWPSSRSFTSRRHEGWQEREGVRPRARGDRQSRPLQGMQSAGAELARVDQDSHCFASKASS